MSHPDYLRESAADGETAYTRQLKQRLDAPAAGAPGTAAQARQPSPLPSIPDFIKELYQ